MSRRAPGSVIAVSWEKVSPVTGVKWGSCFTLGHTRFSKQTNRSLMLSRRWLMKPPLLQLSACSTVKLSPQTQFEGRSGRGRLYLSLTSITFLLNLVIILHHQCNNNWPLVAGITYFYFNTLVVITIKIEII